MAYRGKYRPKNIEKYSGDHSNITYRSLWERGVMKWCDLNPDIIHWNSEEIVIPYICKTDGKPHRYFVDFTIEFKSGKILIVEVKPKSQTKPPKKGKNRNKYLKESLTYAKNISKWTAAKKFADANGAEFQIWDEETLNGLGIRIQRKYPLKRKKKKSA